MLVLIYGFTLDIILVLNIGLRDILTFIIMPIVCIVEAQLYLRMAFAFTEKNLSNDVAMATIAYASSSERRSSQVLKPQEQQVDNRLS